MGSRTWLRLGSIVGAGIAACTFSATSGNNPTKDGAIDTVPDAGGCTALGSTCAGSDMLRTCTTLGQMPTQTTCTWGCITDHCGKLAPAGGGVSSDDASQFGSDLVDLTISGTNTIYIDGDTGLIGSAGSASSVRGAGPSVISGIDYETRAGNTIAMFRFKSLHLSAPIILLGRHAVALVADGAITIDDKLDGRGPCLDASGQVAGPGGFDGGNAKNAGSGAGGGTTVGNAAAGGGGGAYGGSGGSGGSNGGTGPAGGTPYGDDQISTLVGGAGGAGGGGNGGGAGGGGGGALQLVSNSTITINSGGMINVGGCGGLWPNSANGGGGAGAGGAILIEGFAIVIHGVLAANGGGGGAGDGGAGHAGSAGRFDAIAATGGAAGTGTGDGGSGAAAATLAGSSGANSAHGGGGGGGAGRIRLDCPASGATIDGTISPSIGTTATQGAPVIQ